MFAEPEFLSAVAGRQRGAFESSASPTYAMDADTRLVFVNEAWDRFALENGGEDTLRRWRAGTRVLDAIPDVLRDYYLSLYRRVLAGEVAQHEYDCHSPDRARRFRLVAYPLADGRFVAVENSLLVEEALAVREAGSEALGGEFVGDDGLVIQCCHCRRTQSRRDPDRWAFVPVFLRQTPAGVSHGLCRPCLEHYYPAAAPEAGDRATAV